MKQIDWKSLGFAYMDTNCHIRYVWKDGWQFDIGRKPYLVEAPDGTITRLWGRSKEDLIIGCKLSKAHKIVDDPFLRK